MENSSKPSKDLNLNILKELKKPEILILGFGSAILTDDGIALKIVEELKSRFNSNHIKFQSTNVVSLETLDLLKGYQKIILIDATTNDNEYIGEVNCYKIQDFKEALHLENFHDLSIHQLIDLAKVLRIPISEIIQIITIKISEAEEFGTELSEELNVQYLNILKEISRMVNEIIKGNCQREVAEV